MDERFNYLIRFDLSILPANARITSATLVLKAGNVYSGADVSARKITDPDSLGSGLPYGWSNDGPAGTNAYRTGANAVFRNQTGDNAGVRWTAGDPQDEHSHVENAAAPVEPGATVRWDKSNSFYSHTVTQAVQDWVNQTSPNEGWLVAGASTANVQDNFGNQDPNVQNRPELIVSFLPPLGGDTTPPADITDLAVTRCTIDTCTLTWTAPGNDGASGTATRYDIRYSIAPLTEDNWDAAARVVNPPAPAPAGSAESFTVTGLAQAIHYYFAVRALDAAWNFAGVSNQADGKTSPGIFATYHPRIHINRDLNLQQLKDLAHGPLRADFDALRATLDDAMSWNFDDLEENDLLSAVYALGYMYQMTGDNRYADKLIDDYLIKASWMIDQNSTDNMAFGLECAAIAYDWTYARLVERDGSTDPGLLSRVVDRIRRHYAASTDDVAMFRESIREADFHNFVTEYINAWLTTGLALYGDHPDSIPMIQRGWGMLGQGYSFQPTAFNDTFTYNLKASIDMTGGAMNWEGKATGATRCRRRCARSRR